MSSWPSSTIVLHCSGNDSASWPGTAKVHFKSSFLSSASILGRPSLRANSPLDTEVGRGFDEKPPPNQRQGPSTCRSYMKAHFLPLGITTGMLSPLAHRTPVFSRCLPCRPSSPRESCSAGLDTAD